MPEVFDWVQPSPLWRGDARRMLAPDFYQPPLLGFAGDDFMEQFLSTIGSADPAALAGRVAEPEAGRGLKLFQPSHGRYYLTCASLCCRLPGYPDREVSRGDDEGVFFVLRKRANGGEYAWVTSAEGKGWRPVPRPQEVVPEGEERLPLMPATAPDGRALHFGFIPVASRETYRGGAGSTPVEPETEDPRPAEFDERIGDALEALLLLRQGLAPAGREAQRAGATEATLFLLFDLGRFLSDHAPEVSRVLGTPSLPPSLGGPRRALVTHLRGLAINRLDSRGRATATTNVALAAAEVFAAGEALFDPARGLSFGYNAWDCPQWVAQGPDEAAAALRAKVFPAGGGVLAPYAGPAGPDALDVPKLSRFSAEDEGGYVLRYVYERPRCDARRFYVSRRTAEFGLASFFDPDAPARPIRIGLPADVSVAGLRKFKKNVSFMMSKELRNKMGQITGREKEILDGEAPGPEGSFDLGHICSFSIPIITLCAFIVLMIFLVLLNIVFWWLPFLKICFPLRLTAKDG